MARNLTNSTLGSRYRFEDLIGEGTFARVYRVHDLKRSVDLAAKVLREDIAHDPTFSERFRREAGVLGRLQHPHIVRYYETVETDGVVFILLDFIAGETLASYLSKASQPLTVGEALRFMKPITAALSYAHGENIIHRDIKPANVLLSDNGQVFLTDFGIARLLNEVGTLTQGSSIGTPLYMAPEQILNKNITFAADIYAIGVTLYQMFTAQLPFTGSSPKAQGTTIGQKVAYEHLNLPPTPPRDLNPELPQAAQDVVLRCLRKEPTSRYHSAAAVYDALAEAVGAPPAQFEAAAFDGNSKPQPPDAKLPEWSQVMGQSVTPPPQNTAPTLTKMDAQAQAAAARPTLTHAPAVWQPPQPVYYAEPAPSPRPARGRRSNSLMIGLVIGAIIGLGLLCAVVGVLAVSALNGRAEKPTPRPTRSALISDPTATRRANTDLFSRPATPTPPQVADLTTPLPSGSGRSFLYASDINGNLDIFRASTSGSDPRQLTSSPINETGPDVSPDGSQIAYYVYEGEDGAADIWIMNADGSLPRAITNTSANERVVSWSPDGTKLAYHSNADGDYDIYIHDLTSGLTINLTASPFNELAPAWSPDGTRLAFHSNEDGNFNEIFIINADGTGKVQVSDGSWQAAFPAWSPDGSRLAFHIITGQNNYQLCVINADGGGFQYLFESPNNERQPDWSADGQALIYMRGSLTAPSIYFTDLLSGETRELVSRGYFPDWEF